MIFNTIDQKIQKSFSKAAGEYDMLTDLHQEIARELTDKLIKHCDANTILDIGMGTGWMTNRLQFYYPDARVVGLDFSEGMIAQAQQKYTDLNLIQADAKCLPFKTHCFDVVVSNFCFQWMRDLSVAFGQCSKVLKADGRLLMTMFGYETFKELFASLEAVLASNSSDKKLSVKRLAGTEEIEEALAKSGFKDIKINREFIKVRFVDMFDLMKWTKSIGANYLQNSVYLGRDIFVRANDHYMRHFKDRCGAYGTLDVIWVEVRNS